MFNITQWFEFDEINPVLLIDESLLLFFGEKVPSHSWFDRFGEMTQVLIQITIEYECSFTN